MYHHSTAACLTSTPVSPTSYEIRSGREGLPENLRRVCAVHEAGHLVIGLALDVFEPQAVTIVDQGGVTRVELSRANVQTEGGIENYITVVRTENLKSDGWQRRALKR